MPGPMSGARSSGIRPPAHRRILTITDDGGLPSVKTAAPHGLTNGSVVKISGSPVAAYNVTEVVAVTDDTTFALDGGTLYSADAAGGAWSHA